MALREELDLTDWCDSSMLRELNDQRRDGHNYVRRDSLR